MSTSDLDIESARVEAFLAPLASLPPAELNRRRTVRARRLLVPGAITALALGGTGAAVAGVFSNPVHDAALTPIASPLTCSGIIGESASEADTHLRGQGFNVSWRLESYGDVVTPPSGDQPGEVSGGFSKATAGPPANAVVSDAIREPGTDTVIVMTQSPDDPNAPTIVPPDCADGG